MIATFEQRAKQLISRVGDQGPAFFKRDIQKLNEEITNNFQNETTEIKESLMKHFVEAIGLLNQKGGIYATVVTLIDLKLPNFAETIMDKVLENLQKGLDTGDIIIPKYSLIFLGELMNIGLVNSFSYITLLYDLVNEAEKTLKQSFDYYLYIVISILPYLIDGLSEKSGLEFKSLIDNIQEIMKKRTKQQLCLLRHWGNKECEDYLEMLWNGLYEGICKENAGLKVILKPYAEFKEEFKNVKQMKKNKKIYFNNKNQKLCVFFSAEKMQLLEDDTVLGKDTSNQPNFLEKLIIFENLTEIFKLFNENSKILIQRLLHFHCPYNYTSILVEVLFSEVFKLPEANSPLVFYSSLAVSLSNEGQEEFKTEFRNTFFQVIDYLFKRIEFLDVSLTERLIKFMVFYLGNNKVVWDWKKWEFIKEEELSSPRKTFLTLLFQKLVFLLSRKTIEEELPPDFFEFLPLENLYKLKFNEPSSSNYADAEIIMDKLNSKVNEKELEEFLNSSESNNLEATGDFFIEIFMECFLMKTSQSLTHLKIIIERYRNLLSSLLSSKEGSQMTALNSIQEFWVNSEWHINVYILNFLDYKLLKPTVVINWIFKSLDKPGMKFFEDSNYWGILDNLLEKSITKIEYFAMELKKEDNNLNIMELESTYKQLKEDHKANLQLLFKKMTLALSDYYQNQRTKFDTFLQRLISFLRKYRKELEPLYEKLEDELFIVANFPEISKLTPYFKLLI